MIKSEPIKNIWLKSAVLGCLWASSEIVLGSFIHNLRVPFGSSFLTGIGITLLISVSYIWKDKGLFWRSGLICALMKSVSPSAVIFGPMIAIFCESLLLELSVRIFRRNIFSFVLGAMLAMSWTFFHKIASFLIAYGMNLVELYKDLAFFAQKQLNFQFENVWTPIIALWFIYLFMGIVFAFFGIYIGRKAQKMNFERPEIKTEKSNFFRKSSGFITTKTSFFWLFINIVSMITVMVLINFTNWYWWCPAGIAIITIWAIRYNKALQPLKKPRFWLLFFIITMLTSYLFARFGKNGMDHYYGLMVGLQMNFRAAIVIIGFSVTGRELSNPKIRNFFNRPFLSQLPLSLEVAFDTLPFVLGNMPDSRSFLKKPVTAILTIVCQAEFWLEKISIKQTMKKNIIIITGEKGQGKSSLMQMIASHLEKTGIKTGGIIAPSVVENNLRTGYDIINLNTGKREILARTQGDEAMLKLGKYFFYERGFKFGESALDLKNNQEAKIIFIDEIGFLELENKGWAQAFSKAIDSGKPLIIAVRTYLLEKVIKKWHISDPLIINAEPEKFNEIIEDIIMYSELRSDQFLAKND
jgi:nucleoside-triphosphatase